MAYKLNGEYLQVDVPFTVGTGKDAINYPANWLRLTSDEEKKAIGITEVDDPKTYDKRFYESDGTEKSLDDVSKTIDGVEYKYDGVKTKLKKVEKQTAKYVLERYDWQIIRKSEKGTAIDSDVVTYRDGIRAACTKRESEIDACANTDELVTLYGVTTDSEGKQTLNMTQYPEDPNSPLLL